MGGQQGTLAGRFQIDRLAGSGGMGEVYRAWDHDSGAVVALKVLTAESPVHGERLLREAELTRQLSHPNVVRIIDHGRAEDGALYVAMEWLQGEDLSKLLRRRVLAVDEALQLGTLVADALGAAHAIGIVHRDLKPANIFLVDGQLERIKLLDFGIARDTSAQGERLTRTGVLLGTPAYMAPEQVRAVKTVGPPADVWALGAVLFRCLTGQHLFAADSALSIAIRTTTEEPPTLSSVRPDVPPDLDGAMACLLAPQPEHRPHEGRAAAELLRRIGSGRGVELRAPQPKLEPDSGRCVVLARPPAGDDTHAPMRTEVQALASQHRGELHVLADGTAVVVIASHGSLDEQVAAGARCALRLKQLVPGAAIVVLAERGAGGPTQPTARADADLLDDALPTQIRLNDLAARRLPPAEDVQATWIDGHAVLAGAGSHTTVPISPPAAAHGFVPTVRDETVSQHPTAAPVISRVPPAVPAVEIGSTAPAPQPLAASTRRSQSRLPLLLGGVGIALLALAVGVGGGLYLNWGSLGGLGSSAREPIDLFDEKGAGKSSCRFDHCIAIKTPSPKRFAPVPVMPEVDKHVRRLYPGAKLTLVHVSYLQAGKVDLIEHGAATTLMYRMPNGGSRPCVTALVQSGVLALHRHGVSCDEDRPALPVPKCKLSQAWAVARKHGLKSTAVASALYQRNVHPTKGQDQGPSWSISVPGVESWLVDGATCAWLGGREPN